jgi:hypothetical protein
MSAELGPSKNALVVFTAHLENEVGFTSLRAWRILLQGTLG